jgi:hypothetical protein
MKQPKSYIKPIATGATWESAYKGSIAGAKDYNDCTVRAFANCLDIPYSDAWQVMHEAGREFRKGLACEKLMKAYINAGAKFTAVGNTKISKLSCGWHREITGEYPDTIKGMTIKTMLEKPEYQQGKYAVLVRGHIFAVVDAEVIDTSELTAGLYVCSVYTFE